MTIKILYLISVFLNILTTERGWSTKEGFCHEDGIHVILDLATLLFEALLLLF